ncbi:class I SAM-dependent methyltransferase [Chloroflexota bacterium]
MMVGKSIFDEWTERYDQWFTEPIGKLVQEIEGELVRDLVDSRPGEKVLDAGCGTGIFTIDFLIAGAQVVGLDISEPMLSVACKRNKGYDFFAVRGDMQHLPFKDNSFDKTVSITALEFIADAKSAIDELFRVTRSQGCVVVATLNSLSPWAARRKAKTQRGQRHILEDAIFRSPDELLDCSPHSGVAKTAIHFQKDCDPARAIEIERIGQLQGLDTGAFVAVRWEKP